MHGGVEETAIAAAVEVGTALSASIGLEHFLTGKQANALSALEARESDVGHGKSLA